MKKLMVIAVLLVFFTGSAYAAAEWNFYGSARVNTTYSNFDNNPFTSSAAITGLNPAAATDTNNYEQKLYGNARIGAKVNVGDDVYGHFEFGTLNGVNVRILWAEWTFGAGALGIGQNYTPLIMPYSNHTYSLDALNKGDHNMSTFGMLYGSRKPMVRLKFGGFQIAAVQPKNLVSVSGYQFHPVTGGVVGPAAGQPDIEGKLPNIQAKYKYDFDSGHVAVAGGYQTFDVKGTSQDFKVDSYVLAIGGRFNVGGAYFKGNVWGGQNVGNQADILVNGALWSTVGNAGTSTLDGDGFGFARYNDGTTGVAQGVTDKDAIAFLLVAGYEIRKGLYLEAGYGYVSTELDAVGAEKDDAETYYLQSTVFLAPGVFLTPEIGRINMKQDNQPDVTYAGIKWQVNF